MSGLLLGQGVLPAAPDLRAPSGITEVRLTWVEKQTEIWIRFGRAAHEQHLNRRQRVLGFTPNSVFALVRWAGTEYGTVLSDIAIVRPVRPHESYQTLPCVQPGGDILLTANGWPKVERVLLLIDAVEALGIDPVHVAPEHWRYIHNRLAAGLEPRAYTLQQHQAVRLRRKAGL